MSSPVILAIDQGTTSSQGRLRFRASPCLGLLSRRSSNTIPVMAGWSTSRKTSGTRSLALSGKPTPGPHATQRQSRASASPISERRSSCSGIAHSGRPMLPRHRLAGSPHHGVLPPTRGRSALAHFKDRPGPRSVFLRHQASLATREFARTQSESRKRSARLRHHRFISDLAIDGRESPRHGYQ